MIKISSWLRNKKKEVGLRARETEQNFVFSWKWDRENIPQSYENLHAWQENKTMQDGMFAFAMGSPMHEE